MIYWPFIQPSSAGPPSCPYPCLVGSVIWRTYRRLQKKPPINLGGGGGQAKWIVGPVDWNSSLVSVSFVQWMSESAYGRRCLWVVNERIPPPPPPPLVSPGHGLFVGKKCVKVNDLKVARFYCPSPPFNSSSCSSSCFGSGHRMGFPNYVCVGGGQRHRTKL